MILLIPQALSEHLWDLYNSSPEVCHTRYCEKKTDAEIFYSLESLRFFSKICEFNNLLGLKKCSGKLYSISRNILWTLVSCSLRFVILDDTWKEGPKFCHLKTAVLWNVCFCRPFRSQGSDDIFCTIIVKKPCGLL